MEPYIALFRGINVGGRNILPMNDLKALLESMGCQQVKTYIQSGNVVFHAPSEKTTQLLHDIKTLITKTFGFTPAVLLLTASTLHDAIHHNPFPTSKGKMLHFYFAEETPPHPDLEALEKLKITTEDFLLKGSVLYLYAPEGIGRSKLAKNVERFLSVPVTARNWNTVQKLLNMIHENLSVD